MVPWDGTSHAMKQTMTTITLPEKTSDRNVQAIERFAENVTRYWPEFAGAEIRVVRSRDECSASVDGGDELLCAKLQTSVLTELEVLRDSETVGW